MSKATSSSGEICTGAAFGLLAGLMLGMSVSPVVGTVIGPLFAMAAMFLGLQPAAETEGGTGGRRLPRPRAGQAGAFALGCLLALLAGVWIRTHNALSPPLKDQINTLVEAGLSIEQAQKIVIAREMRVVLGEGGEAKPADGKDVSPGASVLFSELQRRLTTLKPARFGDEAKLLSAYKEAGDDTRQLAEAVEKTVPPGKRTETMEAVWEFLRRE